MSVKFTTIPPKSLSQAILSSASTFIPSDILGWDGVALTSADFGTQAFGAFLSADRTILELFEWSPSTVANSSITILYRGLKFDGTQTTEVAANKLDWPAGTTVQLGSDIPQLLQSTLDYINSGTATLTNKRITKRVVGTTSSATPTPNADTTDIYTLTALAEAAAFATPSGTPTNGQILIIRIKSDGTIRALSWSSAYTAGGVSLPSATVASKILTIGLLYNTDNSLNKWCCVASVQEA